MWASALSTWRNKNTKRIYTKMETETKKGEKITTHYQPRTLEIVHIEMEKRGIKFGTAINKLIQEHAEIQKYKGEVTDRIVSIMIALGIPLAMVEEHFISSTLKQKLRNRKKKHIEKEQKGGEKTDLASLESNTFEL